MLYTIHILSSSMIVILRTSSVKVISSIDALSILILNISSPSNISSPVILTVAHAVFPLIIGMKNTTALSIV